MLHKVHAVRLAMSANAKIRKFRGVGKTLSTVLSRFWTKFHQIWGYVRESL